MKPHCAKRQHWAAAALAYCSAALGLALALEACLSLQLNVQSILLPFVAVIAVATWFLGRGPGLLAAVGAAVAASYYFLPPAALAAPSHVLCWGTFLLVAVVTGWTHGRARNAGGGVLHRLLARKRAHAAIAQERTLLVAVLQQMPEGVIIADAVTGRIVLRNEQGSRILRGAGEGSDRVEDFLRSVPFRRDRARPGQPEEWPLARALWKGEIVTGEELEMSTSEGTRTLRVSAAPVLSEDGLLAAGVAAFSDITERKRSAEGQRFLLAAGTALATSLDYQKTLSAVARLTIPVLADWCLVDVVDDEGRIRHVAEAHVVRELEPRLREIALEYAENPEGVQLVRNVLQTGKTIYSPEIRLDGGSEPIGFGEFRRIGAVSGMTVPLRARGRTLGAISLFYSVSGRRYSAYDVELAEDLARRAALAIDNARLYREAQEASRIKDEFLATVSHELRTPLQAMLGWTRLLRTRHLDPAMSAHALEVIERNANAQHKLIGDILDLSRLMQGKIKLAVRPLDLVPAIEHAIEAARPAADSKGIRIDFFPHPDTGMVAGDPDRLQQVFWNLISNAIRFTPEGGAVRVQLANAGRAAQIVVADNGTGIRADILPHIFERFRQGDGSTARPYGGLGMGLAVVRHTVELHGGSVQAYSAGEGKGASFTVTLPATQKAEGRRRKAEDRIENPVRAGH